MAISSTPLERESKLKSQYPEKIRFWFTKNDLWELGGWRSSKLFAVMDFTFKFNRRNVPTTYRVETDLLTATTYGTISQGDGPMLKFKAWVSGAENMIFRRKTTHDPEYARKVYPYFKELTTFWEAYMTFEKGNNRYVIEKNSVHEASGKDFG